MAVRRLHVLFTLLYIGPLYKSTFKIVVKGLWSWLLVLFETCSNNRDNNLHLSNLKVWQQTTNQSNSFTTDIWAKVWLEHAYQSNILQLQQIS